MTTVLAADTAAGAPLFPQGRLDAGKTAAEHNLETCLFEFLLNVVRGYFTGSDVRGGGEDLLHEHSGQHRSRGIKANLEIPGEFCAAGSSEQVRQCCHAYARQSVFVQFGDLHNSPPCRFRPCGSMKRGRAMPWTGPAILRHAASMGDLHGRSAIPVAPRQPGPDALLLWHHYRQAYAAYSPARTGLDDVAFEYAAAREVIIQFDLEE